MHSSAGNYLSFENQLLACYKTWAGYPQDIKWSCGLSIPPWTKYCLNYQALRLGMHNRDLSTDENDTKRLSIGRFGCYMGIGGSDSLTPLILALIHPFQSMPVASWDVPYNQAWITDWSAYAGTTWRQTATALQAHSGTIVKASAEGKPS